ncbi:MAG: ComF family protein [bacterium]|nr:ComF family protein [bacterium]
MGLYKRMIELIYPQRCPICEKIVLPKGAFICSECYKKLQWVNAPYCMKCGKPIESECKEYCYDCENKNFHYEYGYGMWIYDENLRRSIVGFKYKNRREYADFYIQQLVLHYREKINRMQVDVIAPVPVHRRRYRQRGYNQAAILAEGLGKELEYAVEDQLLVRSKYTAPQKTLNDKERFLNLEKAFKVNKKRISEYVGKRVLLVDDIYTTGSTIEACTNVLLQAGVSKVYFISLCIGKGY